MLRPCHCREISHFEASPQAKVSAPLVCTESDLAMIFHSSLRCRKIRELLQQGLVSVMGPHLLTDNMRFHKHCGCLTDSGVMRQERLKIRPCFEALKISWNQCRSLPLSSLLTGTSQSTRIADNGLERSGTLRRARAKHPCNMREESVANTSHVHRDSGWLPTIEARLRRTKTKGSPRAQRVRIPTQRSSSKSGREH